MGRPGSWGRWPATIHRLPRCRSVCKVVTGKCDHWVKVSHHHPNISLIAQPESLNASLDDRKYQLATATQILYKGRLECEPVSPKTDTGGPHTGLGRVPRGNFSSGNSRRVRRGSRSWKRRKETSHGYVLFGGHPPVAGQTQSACQDHGHSCVLTVALLLWSAWEALSTPGGGTILLLRRGTGGHFYRVRGPLYPAPPRSGYPSGGALGLRCLSPADPPPRMPRPRCPRALRKARRESGRVSACLPTVEPVDALPVPNGRPDQVPTHGCPSPMRLGSHRRQCLWQAVRKWAPVFTCCSVSHSPGLVLGTRGGAGTCQSSAMASSFGWHFLGLGTFPQSGSRLGNVSVLRCQAPTGRWAGRPTHRSRGRLGGPLGQCCSGAARGRGSVHRAHACRLGHVHGATSGGVL